MNDKLINAWPKALKIEIKTKEPTTNYFGAIGDAKCISKACIGRGAFVVL
ncbi:MAG: hypothetical protein AAGG56_12900 [Pseudomonadota bacterium]